MWRKEDPQGNEIRKALWEIIPYTQAVGSNPPDYKTRVLDLGCGPYKALPHFVGVDSCIDTKLFGIQMQPDVVIDTCERLVDFEDGRCDAVVSSHLLEHIEDHVGALREWTRVLKPGGHLILYLPHRDFYPNIGHEGSNPDHKHDFIPADIIEAMREAAPCGWDLMEHQERNGGMEYSFFLVFRMRVDGVFNAEQWRHDYERRQARGKTACVVRYGGFGDMIQCAYILPALKREGYHVTVMTTPKGADILKQDPHVDAFYLQEQDQVPNGALGDFWAWERLKYDRWVNLSESIEGTLLAIPGRMNHDWPLAVRQKQLNLNYFEWTADLAGVPFVPEGRFYPTAQEEEDARALKFKMNGFVVMFVMAGSSVHKFYRWQDEVIFGLLEACPRAHVVTVGDKDCEVLEQGFEREPRRIHRFAGKLNIRETMALARHMDAVWGPETGVMNSVANEPMLKVVLLSHSSPENLTKHWQNTAGLTPIGQHCYPCHQLHYGDKHCDVDKEQGVARCQMKISPERVLAPLIAAYQEWDRAYHRLGKAPERLMVAR